MQQMIRKSTCICRRNLYARRFQSDVVYSTPSLVGSCQCGKVTFAARGVSCGNFYSHSTDIREATLATEREHAEYLAAAAFKTAHVTWKGSPVVTKNSDPHFYCACEKKQYLGMDASRHHGFLLLNLNRLAGFPSALPDAYRPNHHLFYEERVVDVLDGLPKWKTVLGGEVMEEKSIDTPHPTQLQGSAHRPKDRVFSSDEHPLEWTPNGVRKDVLPLSPARPPEPSIYHYTEVDPPINSHTKVSPEKIDERVQLKYLPSAGVHIAPAKTKREVVVVGGGHNGLISAAYLSKSGMDTLVLERSDSPYHFSP